MGENDSGGKPPEYWLIAIRDIVERALDRHMCNIVNMPPSAVELAKTQHSEMLGKIDQLVAALNNGLKALYVAVSIVMAVSLIGVGALLFAIMALIK